MTKNGYKIVSMPGHSNADTQGRVYEHRLVAEQMLGRPLNRKEVVHHKDHNKLNNSPDNLLICTQAEHNEMHRRDDASEACGDPMKYRCAYCKDYDDLNNMYKRPKGSQAWHLACAAKYKRVEDPITGPYKYGNGAKYA